MEKLFSSLIMGVCLVTTLQAQTINKTYYDPNRRLQPISHALLQEAGKERIFTSMNTIESNGNQKFMITKADENGNLLKTVLQEHALQIHRIISTSDNCLLVVAPLAGDPVTGGILSSGLMVMKLDLNLNIMWSRSYPAAPYASASITHSNIDVAKMTRGGVEYYYIYYSAQSPLDPQETGFAVAKINGTGALSWHRVYGDPAHADTSMPRNLTGGIAMFNRGGTNNEFALVGKREAYKPGGVVNKLFYMNIDENGVPTSGYKAVVTGSVRPELPAIAWDGTDLVTTYIELNSGIVPGTNNASGIGFLKTDVNYTGFTGRYYWQTCENYGQSITVAPDGNYVISGLTTHCGPLQPVGDYGNTPMFLKLNSASLNPIFFKRYNKLRRVAVSGRHISNAGYNYVAGEVPTACAGCPQGYRLLKTDASLNTCGAADFPINTVPFTPSVTNIPHTFTSYSSSLLYGITFSVITMTSDDCKSSTSPDAYRPGGETGIGDREEDYGITIVPTLLRNPVEQVTCTIDGINGKIAEITVHNLLGQRLYSKKHTLASGSNSLGIPATFSTGINVVSIAVDGKILKTQKIDRIQ